MKYWKLLRYKWLYILVIFVFLYFIYQEAIKIFLFFDTQAPDLARFDGEMVKNSLISGLLKLDSSLFNFSFWTSFIIPIIIVILGYEYITIKEKYVKLYIGKSNHYTKELFKLKYQLASVLVFIYMAVYFSIILLGCIVVGFDVSLDNIFAKHSVLETVFSSQIGYLVFMGLGMLVALFCNVLFCFKLLDVVRHFLRGGLLYLMFIWLFSLVLYRILPYLFVPMTTLMFRAYGYWTVLTLFAPYTFYVLGYAVMSRYRYEV